MICHTINIIHIKKLMQVSTLSQCYFMSNTDFHLVSDSNHVSVFLLLIIFSSFLYNQINAKEILIDLPVVYVGAIFSMTVKWKLWNIIYKKIYLEGEFCHENLINNSRFHIELVFAQSSIFIGFQYCRVYVILVIDIDNVFWVRFTSDDDITSN